MSLSFNNPLIIGDVNKKIQNEIGDLSQLETTDKSSLVNALNEALSSTLNGADTDLSNLTSNGEARLHALKCYEDAGELLTDQNGLAFIKKYARSTFDESKFVKVGSPNITEDGIASGFSSGNYLTKGSFSYNNKIEAEVEFSFIETPPNSSYQGILSIYNLSNNSSQVQLIFAKNEQRYAVNFVSYATTLYISTSTVPFVVGSKYKIIFGVDLINNNIYISSFKQDGIEKLTSILTENITATITPTPFSAKIGCQSYDPLQSFNSGSIDLKQFSITVDGVPVFSGNKTGVDTIKPSNFTAITSGQDSPFVNPDLPFSDNGLTISADGIASGFSSSDYLYKDISISSNSINIKFVFIYKSSDAQQIWLKLTGTPTSNNLTNLEFAKFGGTNNTYIRATINGTANTYLFAQNIFIGNANDSDIIELDLTLSLTGASGKLYNLTQNTNTPISQPYTVQELSFTQVTIGGYGVVGSIDLNALKIYTDGNLVYQPCLKIPYTESKTGSKIVNSIYRDRVNDMAEQFGYAPYYTLSDTDFTLPQGEVYGLIEKVSNRPDYNSVITVSDINGSSKAYTIGAKCLAIIKPSTPASTYTISVQLAYGSAYKSISGYGYMTLEFDTGDKVYASVASSMDIYLIR